MAILLTVITTAEAQPGDYSARWKKIESLEKKGLTRDALKETVSIFNDAVAKGNEPQQIKAAMYQMKYRNMVEEENSQKNIFYIDTLIAKTKAPARNILLSMQALLFDSYKQQNRYKLYNRTALTEEKGNDIGTWSIDKLNEKITSLYKASLSNENLLKSTSLKGFTAILEKGQNTEGLRPTLYDLLAHRALEYFMSTENDVNNPSYKFIINDEAAFAPVPQFISHRFISKDTASLYYNALLILQDLLRFHVKDAAPDALLDADLTRLTFINEHGIFPNKEKLYEAALQHIQTTYPGNPASAEAAYLRAMLHKEKGDAYDPKKGKENQFELATAKEIANAAYVKFPKSEGGINCKNLVSQIERPSLEFQAEKVNIPGEPFRSLVKFKNSPKIYFRIIKTSRDEIKKSDENDTEEKQWAAILKGTAVKNWNLEMPDQKDYQQHAAEIKIDALPAGTYYLLMSRSADFAFKNNILGRAVVFVSNISYISNSRNEFYALNRDNGMPLENATVQLWKNEYNYSTRKYDYIKAASYKTDRNGFRKINRPVQYENNKVQVKYGKDELFTDDDFSNYYYNGYNRIKEQLRQTFLFTDRSIYRPGQTVFFKGIMTATDADGRKSRIISNRKTTIQFFDNNGQKQGSLDLTTNDYGSYNGSFRIPEGLLNGSFYLLDSITNSRINFSVEEYKRPKFSAKIKKPEGSYRMNDSITVTGSAAAFAGNNIDGAKVSYRVVRVVRYPAWFGYYSRIFPPRGDNADMEITNGITTTDAEGKFTVTFKAIPDEEADKKDQPIFDYRVTADITDVNGETRSAEQTISVSYQALSLDINAPEKLAADSIKNIGVSSTNANGLYEKATVHFTMYKLQEPGRMFRERYWDVPDVFVMSKEEYYRDFPYDAYADEDQKENWTLGTKVIDFTDTTAANSSFAIRNSSFPQGYYKVIITTSDKYGEDVKAEKFIQLTNEAEKKITEPIVVQTSKTIAAPGDKISYDISTGFDKIWLIKNLIRSNDNFQTEYPLISPDKPSANSISISDDDRGGVAVNYAFVKHNRVYRGSENIAVPWTEKELKISYETFRDKLLPGAQEKWKIKISGDKAEKVAAETLISMYDASLDQFKPHSWGSLNRLWPGLNAALSWQGETFNDINSESADNLKDVYLDQIEKTYPSIVMNGWTNSYYGSYGNGYYKVAEGMAMAAPMASQARLETVTTAVPYLKLKNLTKGNDKANFRQADANADMRWAYDESKGELNNGGLKNNTNNVTIRKNFNETAFFFPDLKTDEDGNVEFSFTIPEALTQWKLQVMAHTKELASGYSSNTTVTQKELMVQPNAPRFLREGDRMEFTAKISNLTAKEITGSSQLELIDAATDKPVDGWFKNVFPNQYFTVPAGQSVSVKFPMEVPFNFNSALLYRIKAVSSPLGEGQEGASFSDGEEMAIPVLTNRMLVTETMPLNMRNADTKTFTFTKLLNSGNSATLTNHALTVEYTSNPAWYAVQALPYLMEYPYECAEQSFNRFYANTLASNIANSNPKIKAVFEKWALAPSPLERAGSEVDTAVLMSNLQKNEELKSVLLQETPWVLNAQNETQQKKNIALLFDMVRLAREKNKTLAKLKEMQSLNGGFAWFKGGSDDRYMTQYIITGIGHLRKLNALSADYESLKPIVDKALPYLDARLKEEYDDLIKYKVKLSDNNLSYTAIQYLYMRSFFPETAVSDASKKAVDYYSGQAAKYWLSESKYMQAMIALALHRKGDAKTPKAIIESLKQNAIYE